jgi:hypothetical protein
MAYYRIQPFGPDRDDLRQAITSSILANQWRGKGDKPVGYDQFMPYAETDTREQSPAQMLSLARAADETINGTN